MKNIIILAILFIALAGCNSKEQTESNTEAPVNGNDVELTDTQMKNAEIFTGKLEQKNISSVLKVNGVIDVPPQNLVSISAPLGGYLKSTDLLPGMHITKGQCIAVLEDQQYIELQQEYLTSKAKLTFTEQEFNRQKSLNESKASSDKVFQQSQADYTSEKILVKSLSEKLKLVGIDPDNLNENNLSRSVKITSPIDGFVSKVNMNIGKYAKPEDVLFEIVDPSDIHLALNIFEKDINKLSIGQKLIAYTNNNPEKKYECEIALIGKDFSEDRNVVVHCHFKEYDKNLIPGMFMNAEIEIQNNDAYVLPTDAVVSFENKQYIFIAKSKNQFEMREIKEGIAEGDNIEILAEDAKDWTSQNIVIKGAYILLMKLKNTSDE